MRTALLFASCAVAINAAAQSFPITITLSGYKGHLLMNGVEQNTANPPGSSVVVQMIAGDNSLETGDARCSGTGKFCSYIVVTVNTAGKVMGIFPAAVATLPTTPGTAITLNTDDVTIKANGYTGRYYISSDIAGAFSSGAAVTVKLIRGITYHIDAGPHLQLQFSTPKTAVFTSDFRFKLNSQSDVVLAEPFLESATVGTTATTSRTLTFNTVKVNIAADPVNFIYLSSDPLTKITTNQQVTMIQGLLAWKRGPQGPDEYFFP